MKRSALLIVAIALSANLHAAEYEGDFRSNLLAADIVVVAYKIRGAPHLGTIVGLANDYAARQDDTDFFRSLQPQLGAISELPGRDDPSTFVAVRVLKGEIGLGELFSLREISSGALPGEVRLLFIDIVNGAYEVDFCHNFPAEPLQDDVRDFVGDVEGLVESIVSKGFDICATGPRN